MTKKCQRDIIVSHGTIGGKKMKLSERDLRKIEECPLLRDIPRETILPLFSDCGCKILNFSSGETILSPQVKERQIGLLLEGKAIVSTPDPSRNTLLRVLQTNQLFGVSALFSEEPFVSVITAHGACRIFFLTEPAVRRLLKSNTTFLYRYLGFLSGRVRYLNQKIGYLTAGSAERKLALYLTSLGTEQASLDISISALSELLDVGRASLYRAFDKLTEDGYIQRNGRTIRLLQPKAMLQAYQ